MQLTEVSMFGVRSSVITFAHRAAPLRFVLIPTIHIGRSDYYRQITRRLTGCHLVVAETYDGPSSTGLAYLTAMRLTLQRQAGELVHQDIDYRSLGVPTVWPDGDPQPRRRDRLPVTGWLDLLFLVPYLTVTMAVGGRNWLLRRNLEISDDSEPRFTRIAWINRVFLDDRDKLLVAELKRIHAERRDEPVEVAVVYGAAHMPAVVRALAGGLGYRPLRGGDWLTAIDF
ncbi:hypothetical protein [Actinoplanes regularis]|uniref:Uncharacterized protein n=1 Tax=Actinoplanes regularis TaxID=52697 RepID=A0A239HTV8_9ACTN|nr:hypothetical protein [Actinoplanes regularis]GIE91210.1 hypothetical protein Are01nite_76900 [Actinoplanes regularis]SNS84672.1 hypothetical protein SAMN06264365_12621 [Actinoplanes regularis]